MSAPPAQAEASGSDVIGLLVALPAEARSLGLRRARPGACVRWRHGWATLSGIGAHNAMRAAERLLACGVTRLDNWGVAGALVAGLAPGDVLIPERIRYADGDPGFATDPAGSAFLVEAFAGALRVRRGVLWSAQHPVTSQTDRRTLAARSGAVAVDMEAAAVAAVAARAHLPFVAMKAICDPATRDVPGRIARTLGEGGVSLRMLAAIAFGGPATWSAARELARDFSRARAALATASRLLAA
jgi:adenosylhomocysteine nucleosidase